MKIKLTILFALVCVVVQAQTRIQLTDRIGVTLPTNAIKLNGDEKTRKNMEIFQITQEEEEKIFGTRYKSGNTLYMFVSPTAQSKANFHAQSKKSMQSWLTEKGGPVRKDLKIEDRKINGLEVTIASFIEQDQYHYVAVCNNPATKTVVKCDIMGPLSEKPNSEQKINSLLNSLSID